MKIHNKFVSKPTYIKSQREFSDTLHRFDDLDMKLLFELTKDGSISVPILSKKLGINASVLYSRIKRLVKKKLIKKFTVEIDDSLLGIGVKANVGINRDPKLKDSIHKKFMETPEVVSICEVTGRFDIIIQVYAKNLESLHSVVIEKIGKIEGIQNTETFVELQKTDKDPVYLNELT
ncbi:AsnC family transcriptional regulator [Candidatus Nitrosopumilus koreensis AR1]|uniref:AsnC family transcriptional regulator n=2 Tax=Nitrosopumilaceae TaxID=338190 RepID=K0B5P0_9ARCH|nr:AsnC family transcriptional regulator [Candidatus Nitrosopumilus koreensis AR1]